MRVVARQMRGERRRAQIVEAAAAIVREMGPGAVSHRAVAARAGCSLSATTYYFSGLEDLLAEAGAVNIEMWAMRAERVAQEIADQDRPPTLDGTVSLILRATLPSADTLDTHYHQLIAASDSREVTAAYSNGRRRLDMAVDSVLTHLQVGIDAQLMIAIVDGAAVAALSEGKNVRENARALIRNMLSVTRWHPYVPTAPAVSREDS